MGKKEKPNKYLAVQKCSWKNFSQGGFVLGPPMHTLMDRMKEVHTRNISHNYHKTNNTVSNIHKNNNNNKKPTFSVSNTYFCFHLFYSIIKYLLGIFLG